MKISFVLAVILCCSAASLAAEPAPEKPAAHPFVAEYRSDEAVPQSLLDAHVEFATRATKGGDLQPLLLPQAVEITTAARPEKSREYGTEISLPYLKSGFQPNVFSIRRDAADAWLVRTGSTAIWYVETKTGGWRVYRYLDKPIQ